MFYDDNYMDDSLKGSKKAVKWIKDLVERREKSIKATEELMLKMKVVIKENKLKYEANKEFYDNDD